MNDSAKPIFFGTSTSLIQNMVTSVNWRQENQDGGGEIAKLKASKRQSTNQ